MKKRIIGKKIVFRSKLLDGSISYFLVRINSKGTYSVK